MEEEGARAFDGQNRGRIGFLGAAKGIFLKRSEAEIT
jgi:hypothetical protein